MIRVLVADDHPIFRDGLAMLLTSVDGLAASVPKDDLRTVVDELDQAFSGLELEIQDRVAQRISHVVTALDHVHVALRGSRFWSAPNCGI